MLESSQQLPFYGSGLGERKRSVLMIRSSAIFLLFAVFYPVAGTSPVMTKKCCGANTSFFVDSLQLPDKSTVYLYAYNGMYSKNDEGFFGMYGFCALNRKPDNSCSYIGAGESDSVEVKLGKSELIYRLIRWDPRDLSEHPLFEKHYSLDLIKCKTTILAKPLKFDEKMINRLFDEVAVAKENYQVGQYVFESPESTLELLLYIGITEPKKTIEIINSALSKNPKWNTGAGAKAIEKIKNHLKQLAE
jgi:hypothetical protein